MNQPVFEPLRETFASLLEAASSPDATTIVTKMTGDGTRITQIISVVGKETIMSAAVLTDAELQQILTAFDPDGAVRASRLYAFLDDFTLFR